mgnify:CR=1 FL=1
MQSMSLCNRLLIKPLIILGLLGVLFSNTVSAHSVYFVRHFEKETTYLKDGRKERDPRLTEVGQGRALNLAGLLARQPIKHVFSTDYKRTMQSALPTALALGLKVQKYDPRQLDEFAQQLSQLSEDALVVGHSNTTPYLVNTLAGQNITLSEDDYGDIFWVRFDEQGQVVTFKTGRVNRSR